MKTGLRSGPAEWTDERHKRGLAGEQQAIQYLLSRGWHIVAHRFRVGHTEIDLIVQQGSLVAFVEVKARRGDAFGSPLEAVTGAKRRGLVKAARGWGGRYGRPSDGYSFGFIAVTDREFGDPAEPVLPRMRQIQRSGKF